DASTACGPASSGTRRAGGGGAPAIRWASSRSIWPARGPRGWSPRRVARWGACRATAPRVIKPLYLARTGSAVVLASTPRAIVAGLGARPAPHVAAIAEYLATRPPHHPAPPGRAIAEYPPPGLLDPAAPTCFAGIDRVGAGCLVEIDDAGVVERRWAP